MHKTPSTVISCQYDISCQILSRVTHPPSMMSPSTTALEKKYFWRNSIWIQVSSIIETCRASAKWTKCILDGLRPEIRSTWMVTMTFCIDDDADDVGDLLNLEDDDDNFELQQNTPWFCVAKTEEDEAEKLEKIEIHGRLLRLSVGLVARSFLTTEEVEETTEHRRLTNILSPLQLVARCLKEERRDRSLGEEFAKFANQLEAGSFLQTSIPTFCSQFPAVLPNNSISARPHSLRPRFTVFEQSQRGKNYQAFQFVFFIHRRNSQMPSEKKKKLCRSQRFDSINLLGIFSWRSTPAISFYPEQFSNTWI